MQSSIELLCSSYSSLPVSDAVFPLAFSSRWIWMWKGSGPCLTRFAKLVLGEQTLRGCQRSCTKKIVTWHLPRVASKRRCSSTMIPTSSETLTESRWILPIIKMPEAGIENGLRLVGFDHVGRRTRHSHLKLCKAAPHAQLLLQPGRGGSWLGFLAEAQVTLPM